MQGEIRCDRWFCGGLRAGELSPVRIHDWTKYRWPLKNLRNRAMHAAGAAEVADLVRAIRTSHPETRIVLTSHSTGAIIALEAAAQLEPGMVEQVWLLAAAVKRGYDLQPALVNVSCMVNVHSRLDLIFLWAGTLLFGTADGAHATSAGWGGFTGPGSDDAKLEQWAFRSKWSSMGYAGGHLGPLAAAFARRIIAPAIMAFAPPNP